jgi:squalene synthase HpnC
MGPRHRSRIDRGLALSSSTVAARSALHCADSAPVSLAGAYEYCRRLATSHYENFTVASWLMPRAMRPHLHAIYAYARIADDFADEDQDAMKLEEWEHELNLCCEGAPRHPVFVALADTMRKFAIPREPFADLLVAFRSDLDFKGFNTLEDLLAYSRYSANPVGRIVLHLFGYRDFERQSLSDLVCSGLQLANFWQDVHVDLKKNRIYLPRREMDRFNYTADELRRCVYNPEFKALMRDQVAVARDLLRRGARLYQLVDARLRRDVLMFAGGGLAILSAIEGVDYDVFTRRHKLGKFDYLRLGLSALRGKLAE